MLNLVVLTFIIILANRLKSIRKEVVLNEEVQKVSRKYREEKALKVEQQTRILGKMRYEDPNMEVKLGDELRGSLRLLKVHSQTHTHTVLYI